MNRPERISHRIPTDEWEVAVGATYVVTADDLDESGRNKLGMRVAAPLDTLLCGFCDDPIDKHGRCFGCRTIHLQPEEQVWA